jgi:hypothetical protein
MLELAHDYFDEWCQKSVASGAAVSGGLPREDDNILGEDDEGGDLPLR